MTNIALNKKITKTRTMFSDNYLQVIIPFLVVISSLLIKISKIFSMDSDPIWSIAVGRWISENATVPFVDVFSWTAAGREWFSNSWLFCWLMYTIDQYLGYLGIALMIFVVCFITAYFIFLMCKKFHNSTFSVLTFTVGVFILFLITITPRAYIFTFAFVAIIMYLVRFKRDTKLIYFVPLIFVLWSNLQSSMSFGIALLFVEASAGTILFKDKRLWAILILSFLGTFLNPYGINFWDFSFSGFFAPGTTFISEWRAPDFNNIWMLGLYFFMGITGLIGLFRIRDEIKQKVVNREKIMILFWFCAAFLYSLNTGRALQYVLLLWAPCFAAFAAKSSKEKVFLKPVVTVLLLIIFITSITISIPLFPLELDPSTGTPISFVDYLKVTPTLNERTSHIIPSEAVQHLKENPVLLDNLFNSYISGGYLLYNNIEVFIDARESVFTKNNITEDYMKMTMLKVKPELIIDEYDIHTLLLEKDSQLDIYLEGRPGFKKEYEDDTAVIYVRES